jgi:hypothetical protein
MPLVVPKNESSNYERCPEGNHVAVCCAVIDLGTQAESYEGKPEVFRRKIRIVWEIAEEKQSDGKPFEMGKTYNLSTNEKATFRRDLESWRGQKFTDEELGTWEVRRILSVGCMLNVIHAESSNGKTYANVQNIARLPKGMKAPATSKPHLFFSLSPDEFDPMVFDALPERMKEEIKQSPEFREIASAVDANGNPINTIADIPF